MALRQTLIAMLKQLLEDMQIIQQQGAGYYSCTPMIRRYNKLLDQARVLLANDDPLIQTFDDLEESDPVDPADKMKVVQGIRIEIGQLMALLKAEEGKTA